MSIDIEAIARAKTLACQPEFRGEIWEDDADNEQLADFLKCHFHRPILKISRLDTTRRIGITAANQIGKTRIGELIIKHRMKHDPANVVMYDINEDACRDHQQNRFGPLLRSIEPFCSIMNGLLSNKRTRWDVTTKDIRFPGFTFRARPLNEGWTQKITVRYGMISDAALAEKNGQIRRAFVRSRQHEKDDLWVVESQGGMAGNEPDDFVRFMSSTTDEKLFVTCPLCGKSEQFFFHKIRPAEFVPTPPKDVPSLDWVAWIEHHRPLLLSDDGRHCGFRHGNIVADQVESGLDENEIRQSCHYLCYHCGGRWNDDGNLGKIRTGLDESSHYVASNEKAIPGYYGFSIPAWINPKISWGSCLLNFKQALLAKRDGNYLPMQEFYTKWAGEHWNPNIQAIDHRSQIIAGSYETDPAKKAFGDETQCRQMTVDCGKALDAPVSSKVIGAFWFEIKDWSKTGDSQQLARGFVDSWELVAAQQRYWKIPCPRVFIDSAWMPSQAEESAVKFFELERVGQLVVPRTWRMMLGAGANRRLSIGSKGVSFMENRLPGIRSAHDKDGKLWKMQLYKVTWSNLWFEQQLDSILGGGVGVKWEILPREKLIIVDESGKPSDELLNRSLDMESGKNASYSDQLDSRYFDEATKQYKDYEKKSRPTEFRDCALMQLVGVAGEGLLGHVSPKET